MAELTAGRLKELLTYDPETGVFIWRGWRSGSAVAGSVAGSLHSDGYVCIKIGRCLYRAHRLAFLYMTGSRPIGQVDHINMNRADNRWCNLRETS